MKRLKVIFSVLLCVCLLQSVFVMTPSAASRTTIAASDFVSASTDNYSNYGSLIVTGTAVLEYTFNAPKAGTYYISCNAGTDPGVTMKLTVNGTTVPAVSSTGSSTSMEEISFGQFQMKEGKNTIKVASGGQYTGLTAIYLEPAGDKKQTDFRRTKGAYRNYYLPVIVEAEDFDLGAGGCGSADGELSASDYRESSVIPVVKNAEGYHITLSRNDWTKYTFNVIEDSSYKVAVKTQSGGMLNLYFDGQEKPITARIPGAGDTDICVVKLKKGVHSVKVEAPDMQTSLDGIEFYASAEEGMTPEEIALIKEAEAEVPDDAKIYREFYVSADAEASGDGSAEKPFKTIEEAKSAVRAVSGSMDGDIVVKILPGEYELDEKLVFTKEDGGKNGYKIIYHGANAFNPPIISGGTHISGWTKMPNGIYKASVAGQDDVRQLYINGYAAQRARSKYTYNFTGTYDDPETSYGTDGYTISKINFPVLTNPSDIELVFNILWSNQRVPVKDIIETDTDYIFVFDQPYFEYIMTKYYEGTNPMLGNKCYIENAYELIDEPGEFYFNKETHEIFYKPFPEEDMTTADTVVGRTEFMLEASGNSQTDRIENLTFSNLDFRYGTWLDVNRTGVSVFQADCIVDEEANSTVQGRGRTLPAQLQFNNASNITVKNCRFQNLGSSAVSMLDNVENSKVDGNVFRDISGSAVVVGSWRYDTTNNTPSDLCREIDITNNVIRRNGLEYYSSVAVGVYYAHGINVSHNDIEDTTYTGITLGWGWGSVTPKVLESNEHTIANNRIVDIGNSVRDGGHIYMLGEMRDSVVEGNYCVTSTDYGGIYYDNGTALVTSRNNVTEDCINSIFGLWNEELKYGNQSYGNYSDKLSKVAITEALTNKAAEEGLQFYEPTVVEDRQWPEEAQKIIDNAGLERSYKRLLNGVDYPAWRTFFTETAPSAEYKSVNIIEQPAYIYMDGGEGVAYHKNQADTAPVPYAQGGGYVIGGTSDGEWINYEIETKVEGMYNFELSYALAFTDADEDNTGSASKVSVYVDNQQIIDKFALTPTGSWTAHLPSVIGEPVKLTKGKHIIRVEIVDNGWSFEKFRLINTVVTETEAEFDDGMRQQS